MANRILKTLGSGINVAATAVGNAATTADVDALVAANASLRLMGYSVRESKSVAAAATVQIVNGATGAAAGKVVTIELALDTSKWAWFGPNGISCPLGISIDWVDGEVDIYVYYTVVAS